MNYLAELKAFYDRLELNPLPAPAIALWHALMSIANRTGWQQEFTVAVSVLVLKSGLNAQAIKRARNRLEQDGYIIWRSRGGNQSAIYHMVSLVVQNDGVFCTTKCTGNVPQNDPQSEPQPEPQSVPINKHKQKQDIKSNTDVLPERPDALSVQCATICEYYNSICGSYPRLAKLSDARKRAIGARLKTGYTVDDFRRLFEMAEDSNFLKGKNDRNWSATFDWLIADKNMAKVLDGNYQNKGQAPAKPKGTGFINFQQRETDYDSMVQAQVQQWIQDEGGE